MATIGDGVRRMITERTGIEKFSSSETFGELGFDSLDYQDFVFSVEEKFGVDMIRFEEKNLHSVGEGIEESDVSYMHVTPNQIINYVCLERYANASKALRKL